MTEPRQPPRHGQRRDGPPEPAPWPPDALPLPGEAGHQSMVWQPALDDYAVPDPEGDEDPDRLWGMRPVFARIHQFARARRVGPWAVLGNVLARVVAATPPTVQLPPLVGGHASINLFVGLVGPSGAGKDASRSAARELFRITTGDPFATVPLGSGEGLSHMFMRLRKPRDDRGKIIKDADPVLEQYNTAALVTVGEIDTLGALVGRRASTVLAQLRQAAMGEQLGFFYVDSSRRMIVPDHAYRLCLVAGIQPARAAVLLDDADGGTPQRFLWLPVQDRDAPDHRPRECGGLSWGPPEVAVSGTHEVKVCDQANETLEAARLARLRGEGEALDGHALLTRLKVATALGLLEQRPQVAVTEGDWEIAGIVMEMSDMTRAQVVNALSREKESSNRAAAEAEASRAAIVKERLDINAQRRLADRLRRVFGKVEGEGWVARSALRRHFSGHDRELTDAVLRVMLGAKEVEMRETEYRGHPGEEWRIARR